MNYIYSASPTLGESDASGCRWAIGKAVTQTEVSALVALAVLDQRLDDLLEEQRPWLRMGWRSPNTTGVTKGVIQEGCNGSYLGRQRDSTF